MSDPLDPFAPFFEHRGAIILDGGMASELERRGADLQDALWSAKTLVETPRLICDVHLDYFRAGADVAITASYQATFDGLARRGIDHRTAAALLRSSVTLARDALDLYLEGADTDRPRPIVAASVGCYGAALADGSEYRGDYGLPARKLMDFHRPRLEVLLEAGPDLLACETVPCPTEAEALVRLLEDYTEASAWISFSCRDGQHVSSGDPIGECIAVAGDPDNVVAVGVNCTAPQYVLDLVGEVSAATSKPVVCYPNTGGAWDPVTKDWTDGEQSADFGEMALRWYEAGARLIGGCCRTGPETIRAIVDALDR